MGIVNETKGICKSFKACSSQCLNNSARLIAFCSQPICSLLVSSGEVLGEEVCTPPFLSQTRRWAESQALNPDTSIQSHCCSEFQTQLSFKCCLALELSTAELLGRF